MSICNRAGCTGRRIRKEQLDQAAAMALDAHSEAIERRAHELALSMLAGKVSLDMIRASSGAQRLFYMGVPVTPEQMDGLRPGWKGATQIEMFGGKVGNPTI